MRFERIEKKELIMKELLWKIFGRVFGIIFIGMGLAIPWTAFQKLGLEGLTWKPYTLESYVLYFLLIAGAIVVGLALLIAPPSTDLFKFNEE